MPTAFIPHPSSLKEKGGDRVKKIGLIAGIWLVAISSLHAVLNVDWNVLLNDRLPFWKRKLNVAYIPVT